jgi:predicted alpha/beta superfamily hydrolase
MTRPGTAFRWREITEHSIESRFVGERFQVKILQPARRSDGSECFPVLYTTDADDHFGGYADLATQLHNHGEAARFILVGLGYRNPRLSGVLRMRDFFSHANRALLQSEIQQLIDSPMIGGLDDVAALLQKSDATQFLQFITEELMPFVNAEYPTVPGDANYCGYSAGGGFGLHVLFSRPDTFKRYILGSPATSYAGQNFAVEMAKVLVESGRPVSAQVFMSVGELEEFKKGFGPFDLVTGYYHLAKFLNAASIPGLDLKLRVFAGETHATAWPLAFVHGVKRLFGAADVPYDPEFLK